MLAAVSCLFFLLSFHPLLRRNRSPTGKSIEMCWSDGLKALENDVYELSRGTKYKGNTVPIILSGEEINWQRIDLNSSSSWWLRASTLLSGMLWCLNWHSPTHPADDVKDRQNRTEKWRKNEVSDFIFIVSFFLLSLSLPMLYNFCYTPFPVTFHSSSSDSVWLLRLNCEIKLTP